MITSFVQSATAADYSTNGVNTLGVTFNKPQGTANFNAIVITLPIHLDNAGNVTYVSTVTDTALNNYILLGPTDNTDIGIRQYIAYAYNITGLSSNTITVNFGGIAVLPNLIALEYYGVQSQSDPFDGLTGLIGVPGTGSFADSGSITTTNPNDIIIGVIYAAAGNITAGSGWSSVYNNAQYLVEQMIVSTAGQYDATAAVGNGSWIAQVASFKSSVFVTLPISSIDTTTSTASFQVTRSINIKSVDKTSGYINFAVAGQTIYLSDIVDAGTAAARNIPASGNATLTQVVLGSDTRLTNARFPTAHASTHVAAGSDPLTLTRIQISDFAHAVTHAHGGTDPVTITYSDLAGIPSSFNPSAHHVTHQSGGTDVIAIDLLGAASDNTNLNVSTSAHGLAPKAPNDTTKVFLGNAVYGTLLYSSLGSIPSSFNPSAHATTHESGGSDQISLDTLAAPTDITTLNSSTSAHGLLKKLDNIASHFMDGTGNWNAPTKSGQANLNFGSADNGGADTMVAKTTVTATWLTANSTPTVSICTGLDHTDSDDILVEELQAFVANLVVGASFDIIVWAPNGTSGQYAVNYFSNF